MRAHKITSQALWRLFLPPLLEFLKDSDREIYDEIIAIKTDHVSIELALEMLQTDAQQSFLLEIPAGFQQVAELHLQNRLLPILRS
jgi:hypothetical protein